MTKQIISTDRQIGLIKPTDKRVAYTIKNHSGLTVVVHPTGKKSFATKITCSETKKRKTITLGDVAGGTTIAQAAAQKAEYKALGILAKEAKDRAALNAELKQRITTLDDVLDDYYSVQLRKLKAPEAVTAVFDRFIIPLLADKALDAVKPLELTQGIIAAQNKSGDATAAKMFSYLKSFFDWAVAMGHLETSPAASIKRKIFSFVETPRSRCLSREEVPILMDGLTAATRTDPRTKLGIKLLLLTGVRSGELLKARWSDVDFTNALWTLPAENTKTSTKLVIPLAPQSVELFTRLKDATGRSPFVMGTANGASKVFIKALTRLQMPTKKGLILLPLKEKLTAHDLRRSFTTFAAGLGVPFEVRERMVNHSIKGVSATYNRWDYLQERKEAAILIANAIDDPLNLLPSEELELV